MAKTQTLNSNDKFKIKSYFYKSLNSNNIIQNHNLFKFILFLVYNILISNAAYIQLKVNGIGNQQILSDYYDIEKYYPFRIFINDNEVQILREKKVLISKITDIIKLEWIHPYHNLSYLFANVSSITSITMSNMINQNTNISYMFYNCISLQNFSMINNPANIVDNFVGDMRYMFYNCYSLNNFSFDKFRFDNYIDISYIFYNCSNLKYVTYNTNNNIKVKDMRYSFYNCNSLVSINFNKFETSGCINMSYAFYNCFTFDSITINNYLQINDMRFLFFNNTGLKYINIKFSSDCKYNMSYSFYNCKNLQTFSCNNWLIRPNDMRNMFFNSGNLIYIEFELGGNANGLNMTRMFYNCNNISIVKFKETYYYSYYYYPSDLHAMFYNCTSLTSVYFHHFKSDKVEDMSYMFYNCIILEYFISTEYFNNYLTTNLKGMFENCEKLTSFSLSSFDTSNVEIMWSMFKGCTGLTYINLDNFDTSKVTDMESMFEGCSNLTSLNLKFNTTKVQYMNKMFKDCISLENLYFKNINTSSIGTMHQMFYNCRSLKYVNLYNLEERGQSVIDIFEKASNDFKICVKEHENIPKIFNILYNLENANRDCSGACYGDWRIEIPEKKYCCPKFKYEDNCYDKCPSKTKTYSNYFDGKICQSFNCSYLYNYEQSECITSLTPGHYINDTESKTIDKCHKNCLTCKGKGIDGDSNCTKCKENVKNIFRGNCYDTCLDGTLPNSNECKCFEKKCLTCSEESLAYDLCLTCNEKEGYFEKIDENINISNFVDCYKNPEKYFHNSTSNKYEPCFNSCEYCTQLGNYETHYCTKCDFNFSFAIQINDIASETPIYNCYPNCTYYYYFDENNVYQCTEGPKCPKEYGRLVFGSRQCVKNCSDHPLQKKEYRKTCYEKCPVDPSLLIEVGDLCRAACPSFEEPFEMVEQQVCVSNCTIMERKDGLCITNYVGNKSNAEVQDKVLTNLMEDIIETFNYSYVDDYTSIVLEEKNHTYEIITTNSKVRNPKTSTLYLKNCENTLKSYYGIDPKESLHVLKLDAYRDGQTGPTVEYQIYYSFNGLKLEQLDLTLCEGDGISLLISFNMTDGEDLYNKNSGYYNDICYTFTTGNGTDLTLEDRQQEFSENNKSLCEEGCEFVKYHKELGQAECSCDVKTNLNLVSDIKVDKTKLYQFLDIKKIANFDVMKCYNLLLSIDGIKGNIGFYLFFPPFIMLFISIILFYVKEFKTIKQQISDIVYAKTNFKYLDYEYVYEEPKKIIKPKFEEPLFLKFLRMKKVDFPILKRNQEASKSKTIENKIENRIENKIEINIKLEKKSKKNKKKVKFSQLQEIKEAKESDHKENPNEFNKKNKKNLKNKKAQRKNIKLKNKDIFNENINNEKISKDNYFNAPPIKNFPLKKPGKNNMITEFSPKSKMEKLPTVGGNDKIRNEKIGLDIKGNKNKKIKYLTDNQKEKIKMSLKYNDNELNNLSYKEAIKYDHRTFWGLYFSLLKSKHLLLTLLEKRDYNARGIKVFFCFFSFALGYATNALFFNDDTMHQIHEDGGEFNFWYQLPQIIYSAIISYIIENFLNYLAFSEEDVISLKKEKVIKSVERKSKEVKRRIGIKVIFFYIISFILLIVFWYYIACFCSVYKNTQYHLIKDTLIGFVTSLLYPFGMYILPPIFRIPALQSYSKTKEAMYKFSQFLLFF